MALKHKYIALKHHWNLNISETLQRVFNMNNILELLLKYHFHVLAGILLQVKSQCARGASHHSAFMGSCPTISHTFSIGYPVDDGNENVGLFQD